MENNENTNPENKKPSELDYAAYDLQRLTPRMLALAGNMKAGALFRVFSMVMQYPLVDNPKRFKSKEENELFIISLQLLASKSKILSAYSGELKDAQDEAVDAMLDEIRDHKIKGETNGE